MKTYIIFLSLLALLFCACKNEPVQPITRFNTHSLNAVTLSPANPANPYDTIGERHNLILNKVVLQLCGTCKPDQAVTANEVSIANSELKLPVPNLFYYDTVVETVSSDPTQIISTLNCSAEAKKMLSNLFAILKNTANAPTDFLNLKRQIISLENATNGNVELNEVDKAIVLSACSVARFSSFYWGFSNPPVKSYSLKGITKWIAAATSDVAGAVVFRSASYAADCSSYAYWLIVYSMPG
ncbi:MAG: hypothetical protein ACTHJ0_15960 [Flavipsychrobacter sp.]